jgi:CRP/FNR family cyclic AMP-dependent transcriptional regulator
MSQEHPFRSSSTWMESACFDWGPYWSSGTEVQVRKDEHVFREGDPVTHVYVVKAGRIRLSRLSLTGEEKAIVVVGRSGLIGEVSAMLAGGYVTSSIAAADSVLLRIRCEEFRRLFHTDTRLAEFVCQSVSHKFKLLSDQVTTLSYATAQYRVARYLLELAETYGESHESGVRIGIQFTHQEMANLAGTTRVTVAQVFRRLEQFRILKREGEYYEIPSLEALRDLLNNPKASHFQNSQGSERAQ